MSDANELDSLEETDRNARVGLSEEQQANLSKALFPDTHTEFVEVMGVTRTLRPLPVKFARRLHALLKPVAAKIEAHTGDAQKSGPAPDLDTPLLDGCMKAAKVLCTFYGDDWADLKEALDKELIQFTDVQALLVQQAALQNANDFLLSPLRIAVGTMRFVEMGTIQYLSMFSGLHSLNNIDVLSTNSSPATPQPS